MGKAMQSVTGAGTSETYIGILRECREEGFLHDTGVLYGPFVDGGWFYMASVPSSGHSIELVSKKAAAKRAFLYGNEPEAWRTFPGSYKDALLSLFDRDGKSVVYGFHAWNCVGIK